MNTGSTQSRRDFTRSMVAAGIGLTGATTLATTAFAAEADADAQQKLSLGIDNFAVRAMGWKAKQLIDYAGKLKVDSLFITDLYAFESLEQGHVRDLRKMADDAGVNCYLESGNERNLSFYLRHGFEVAEEVQVPDGPRVWGMLRRPSSPKV